MKVESLQLSSKFHQNQMIWQYNDSQNGARAYRFFENGSFLSRDYS